MTQFSLNRKSFLAEFATSESEVMYSFLRHMIAVGACRGVGLLDAV